MDLIGIENEAEFFPSGTLSDVLKDELQDITSRWGGLDKAAHPVERLSRVATPTIEALRQVRNASDPTRQSELVRDAHHALLAALGYTWRRETALTALNGTPVIPLVGRVADASGRDALWIIEAPLTDADDEAADPLGVKFTPEQFPEEVREAALLDRSIEETIAEGVFELPDGPRHLLVLGLSQMVLVDKRKWPARSVLRFDLQEIFTRAERDTLIVMACLTAREARVPEQGVPISDRLEEEAQRNANAVTTSLKRTVRDAIELLGQEALEVTGGKYPSTFPEPGRRGVWIDGPELSRECLRYMYRLLFLFYAEANPRLNLLDLRNPIYATGYSLEALRELESVPLRTTTDREGTFLWDSLQRTLDLLHDGLDLVDEGKATGLRLPAVKVSLLDPESTPLLNGLRLRNEAIQKVIRLLSLRSTGKSTGRISYAKLGIGQLGAVYETLISFTGVVAKTDLIELKPRKGRSADAEADDNDAGEAAEVDEDAEEEEVAGEADSEPEDDVFRRDKVDPLAPSWFVPRSRIGEFAPEEIVFKGAEALVYPKGTFIYRLAGRDREKSASYYTPEPLARLLVKHALMERCRGLTADELLDLKILEPAMGSAAFLVETTNQLADLYLERKQKETGRTIPQDQVVVEKQRVRAYIADRNCFGVDLNPIAVELGAISLWLNSLHASDFSPWFGDQLYAGNSLIGARRAAYSTDLLSARAQADLWLNGKPEEIGWRKRLPEGHVWQWLLPAKDMANFDKDKSIAPFAKDAQDQIKAWRKDGFFKKLEPHEIKLVQKLSRVAEALFDQVANDLARSRGAANDEITIWPDKVMPGNKGMDFHDKARLNARITGEDRATNTLPYKRLKTAMDAWCALWLWPLDRADQLPSRAEFFQGMAMIIEGGFTADGALAAPSVAEFSEPAPDFFDRLDPDAPARDLFKAADKRQEGLFRETNVEALTENFDWLKTAIEVAERERFVHFDLIFADVMKARGGFDVIVGNPPWTKPSWNEQEMLGEIDPAALFRNLCADEVLRKKQSKSKFLEEFVAKKGFMAVTSNGSFFPFAGSGANNSYRCFIDLSLKSASPQGIIALIHEDGHLVERGESALRKAIYPRIIKHFHFRNIMKSKMFSEIGHKREYSCNLYQASPKDVSFEYIYGAVLPSQIDECYMHDGVGPLPLEKEPNGKRSTQGHLHRIVRVTEEDFNEDGGVFALLDDRNTSAPPLVRVLGSNFQFALRQQADSSLSKPNFSFSNMVPESTKSNSSPIIKAPGFPRNSTEVVIASPHIGDASVLFQCSNSRALTHGDYDVIDLNEVLQNYLPRTKYAWRMDEAKAEFSSYASNFRLGFRRRVDMTGARSFSCAIIPRGWSHIETISSVYLEREEDLLSAAAIGFSLVADFVTRSVGQTTLREGAFSVLPFAKLGSESHSRVLHLTCLTSDFEDIWNSHRPRLLTPNWSLPVMSELSAFPMQWDPTAGLRTEFARRIALIEIDVLVAQALGLTLDQLIDIYRIYFPVLQEYEAGTWFDKNGRIVWTCSKGLPGVGWLDDRGKSPGRAAWEKILAANPSELTCTAIDDTMPGGPRTVTRHFIGPFTQCDRIEDYKRAWAHFERLKSEKAA